MAGMDIMIAALMKNLPPEVLNNINLIGQTIGQFKEQLNRIEAKLDAINGEKANEQEIGSGERTGSDGIGSGGNGKAIS